MLPPGREAPAVIQLEDVEAPRAPGATREPAEQQHAHDSEQHRDSAHHRLPGAVEPGQRHRDADEEAEVGGDIDARIEGRARHAGATTGPCDLAVDAVEHGGKVEQHAPRDQPRPAAEHQRRDHCRGGDGDDQRHVRGADTRQVEQQLARDTLRDRAVEPARDDTVARLGRGADEPADGGGGSGEIGDGDDQRRDGRSGRKPRQRSARGARRGHGNPIRRVGGAGRREKRGERLRIGQVAPRREQQRRGRLVGQGRLDRPGRHRRRHADDAGASEIVECRGRPPPRHAADQENGVAAARSTRRGRPSPRRRHARDALLRGRRIGEADQQQRSGGSAMTVLPFHCALRDERADKDERQMS